MAAWKPEGHKEYLYGSHYLPNLEDVIDFGL